MLVNLNDVLKDAQKNHYGVGLFNTTDTDMLQAAIDAAEEARSPIVIGTAEVLLPFGDLKWIAPSIIAAAKRASVVPESRYISSSFSTRDRARSAIFSFASTWRFSVFS